MPEPRPARSLKPAAQLALDLPAAPRHGIEDFLVGPSNEEAYALIESWPAWPDPVLLLVGPEGSGKTHLSAIWAQRAHAWRVGAGEVTAERVPELASSGSLVVEDIDRQLRDEAAFFHLINRMRARSGALVLTARSSPESWGLKTADVLSRLRLAPSARLNPPDDALLKAVLVKLFLDRQLIVDTGVIDAVVLHIPRTFADAQDVVAAIDRAALERGRRVTRALAAACAAQCAAKAAE